MAERKEELKSPLMKVKEDSEKSWLKSQHPKLRSWHPIHHFMANRGGEMETVTSFIFLGFKITVDSDCSHEIKRHMIFGEKATTKLDSILKR